MDLKRTVFSLLSGVALLAPAVAFAHHDRDDDDDRRGDRYHGAHQHSASYHHGQPAPQPQQYPQPQPQPQPQPTQAQGRYELRTVQKWVDGYWTKDWVPEQCTTKHKRWKTVTRCSPGYATDRWVDGRYENAQEWVWVPYSQPQPGRPGFRVSMRF